MQISCSWIFKPLGKKNPAFPLQLSYEVKCVCHRNLSQVTKHGASSIWYWWSSVQLGTALSDNTGFSTAVPAYRAYIMVSWWRVGVFWKPCTGFKVAFNVGSSICSNPYSRFLHQCSSQSKVFIKKNQGSAPGEYPHSPGKQLSILTPGLEANLRTCWEASLASETLIVCTVHYKLYSQSISVPADTSVSFVWLCTNSAFSSCLFIYVKERFF